MRFHEFFAIFVQKIDRHLCRTPKLRQNSTKKKWILGRKKKKKVVGTLQKGHFVL